MFSAVLQNGTTLTPFFVEPEMPKAAEAAEAAEAIPEEFRSTFEAARQDLNSNDSFENDEPVSERDIEREYLEQGGK
jgi:hypothetical protein